MKIARIEASVHAAASAVPLLGQKIEDYRGGPPRPFVGDFRQLRSWVG